MPEPDYPVRDWIPLLQYGDDAADTNLRIVTDIYGHPAELPTEREMVYMLTATDERDADDVREQLDVLCDAGLVERIGGDEYTFYGLTHDGKQYVVDSKQYRGHEVFKNLYHHTERTDDVEAAYHAERPEHPPATTEYEETRYAESDEWAAGRASAFRTLILSLDRTGDRLFEATLVEGDADTTLATVTVEVESVDDFTDDHREMEVSERRGTITADSAYSIEVEREGTTYKLQPEKNGEGWYTGIERSLYIFTDEN